MRECRVIFWRIRRGRLFGVPLYMFEVQSSTSIKKNFFSLFLVEILRVPVSNILSSPEDQLLFTDAVISNNISELI